MKASLLERDDCIVVKGAKRTVRRSFGCLSTGEMTIVLDNCEIITISMNAIVQVA